MPSLGIIVPPVRLTAGFADVGAPTSRPFVILAAGQSNMQGEDTAGSKTVLPGIYITNDNLSPTAVIPAAFGTAPLNTNPAGGTASTAAGSANNMAVAFANALRASGRLPASRPIVIIADWLGGQSIGQWVGTGTSSPMWQSLVAGIAAVNAAYPGFTIDHIMWAQGENDSSALGTYGTQALYGAAFATLLAQWRALPQVTADTKISVQELAAWYNNNSGCGRNDFIRTLSDGAYDTLITMVSSSGTTESTDAPGPHFDGTSLIKLGQRHFAAWVEGSLQGRYGNRAALDKNGTARIVPASLSVTTGGTLNVGTEDLRANGAYINASGGTINLPPGGMCNSASIVINASATTTLNSTTVSGMTSAIHPEWLNAGQTTMALPAGRHRIVAWNGDWWAESVNPRTGSFMLYSKGFGAGSAQTVDTAGMRGAIYLCSQNTVTLPTPSNGGSGSFYNAPNAAGNTTLSGTIVTPSGVSVSSYVVPAGSVAKLEGQNATWVVVSDTLTRLSHNTTANRPTGLGTNDRIAFFDDTLGKPIWWKGAAWVDATGATV